MLGTSSLTCGEMGRPRPSSVLGGGSMGRDVKLGRRACLGSVTPRSVSLIIPSYLVYCDSEEAF